MTDYSFFSLASEDIQRVFQKNFCYPLSPQQPNYSTLQIPGVRAQMLIGKLRKPFLRKGPLIGISEYIREHLQHGVKGTGRFFILFNLLSSCPVLLQCNIVPQQYSQMRLYIKVQLIFFRYQSHLTGMGAPVPSTLIIRRLKMSETVTPSALPKGNPESEDCLSVWNNQFFLPLFLPLNPFTLPSFFVPPLPSISQPFVKKWLSMGLLEQEKTK